MYIKIKKTKMKHTRKRRAFAQRLFPISLTSLRREVANRRFMYSAHFRRDEPGGPFRDLSEL